MWLLWLVIIFDTVFALFEGNDYVINLQAGQVTTVNSSNYPGFYQPGSSSRFIFIAPNGYQVTASCNIEIARAPSSTCTTELFYIATDYQSNLLGAEYMCGTGSLTRVSLFNRLIIAHTSTSVYDSGRYSCQVSVGAQPAPCDCGWTRNSKMVGGIEAEVGQYVSMVGLIYRPSGSFFCGGVIISYRYILSAAHCFDTFNRATDIVARLGDHNLQSDVDTIYAVDMNIVGIKRHEEYNFRNQVNDIAVLTTETDIAYTRGVGPACLPFLYAATFTDNRMLYAAGWGTTEFSGPLSPILLHVGLNVISNEQCSIRYPNVVTAQLCTFTPGRDACQYDSGGGLYFITTRSFVAAIISYGSGCAQSGSPSVNTRITSYLQWILANTPGAQYCGLVF